VILETTGLADPAPVAFTFFANPWIVSRFRLDSIVCVVDTRYVMEVRFFCVRLFFLFFVFGVV
jgi:G3E family GTPase